MRQKLAICILLTFSFAEIKPFLPIVDYLLNYEYISEVLCINREEPMTICYGRCYLTQELKNAQETDSPKKAILKFDKNEIPMVFYQSQIPTSALRLIHKYSDCYAFSIKEVPIVTPTPPPQV